MVTFWEPGVRGERGRAGREGWHSFLGHAGSRGHEGNRGRTGTQRHDSKAGIDHGDGPEDRPVFRAKNEPMRSGLPLFLRMPRGKARPAQRSHARPLLPMPTSLPSIDALRTVVLRWVWNTRSKRYDLWRLRAVVALCVVVAVPTGTPMTHVCSMLPREVRRLPMPSWAKRRLRMWLNFRSGFYGASPWNDPSDSLPWLSLPGAGGTPKTIAWTITRMLVRSRAPCWRVRQLLRGPRWPESLGWR